MKSIAPIITVIMTVATIIGIDACSPQKAMSPDATADDYHSFKAPLYWSIYEYCWKIEQGQDHVNKMDFTESQWDEIINYVSTNLLPYGYDMLCTDGFISMTSDGTTPYMTDEAEEAGG